MSLFYINEPLKPYKYQSIAKEMDTYGYKCTNGYIYIYIYPWTTLHHPAVQTCLSKNQ